MPRPRAPNSKSPSLCPRWRSGGTSSAGGGPGGVPPPDQEAEEGAGVLEDPGLPLRHRDRPASLDDGQDLRDVQEAMGGGEFLQGIEPVVQFGEAALQQVPGESVLPGVAQCGVQPDAVLQAGLLTTGLPGGGLRHGASSLPGACGDDRGAECGGDPLDLQCGLPAATRSQHHAAKSSCGIATFGIPVSGPSACGVRRVRDAGREREPEQRAQDRTAGRPPQRPPVPGELFRLIRFSRAPNPARRKPIYSPEQRRGKGVGVRGRDLGPLVPPPEGWPPPYYPPSPTVLKERRARNPDEPFIWADGSSSATRRLRMLGFSSGSFI